jgi:GT2 family glycosyltransferase
VVLPTWNRLGTLRQALEALGSQTVSSADFEVVVVSDGSTDGTDEEIRRTKTPFSLNFFSQENAGPASARNRGVALASGDLVLFLDDDVVPEPHLLEEHLRSHGSQGDRVVVIGPMLTPADYRPNPFVRWEQAMLYKQYEAMERGDWEPNYRQFYTGNASLRRELLLSVGGFDERFRRAEDVETAYRLGQAGATFFFNNRAVGYHYAQRSFESWLKNAREYGRNDVIFDRDTRSTERVDIIRREFRDRHAMVRWLTRRCLGRPWLESSLSRPARTLAEAADRVGCHGVARSALSALYNTSYYSGVASELGGEKAFWNVMDATTRGYGN